MGDLHIPEEAWHTGWHEFRYPSPATGVPSTAFRRGLAAAAPIILAAELRRLADWHFPSEPNSREGEAVCAVLNALRGRADELERGAR